MENLPKLPKFGAVFTRCGANHTNWLPMDKWMDKKLMEKRAMPEPKKEIRKWVQTASKTVARVIRCHVASRAWADAVKNGTVPQGEASTQITQFLREISAEQVPNTLKHTIKQVSRAALELL